MRVFHFVCPKRLELFDLITALLWRNGYYAAVPLHESGCQFHTDVRVLPAFQIYVDASLLIIRAEDMLPAEPKSKFDLSLPDCCKIAISLIDPSRECKRLWVLKKACRKIVLSWSRLLKLRELLRGEVATMS